jgi:hypothetical protein
MKTRRWTPLFIVALLVAGSGSRANANLFSDNFEMLVVAERAKDVSADAGKPTSYVAFDGGYIEAGDPIAGDSAPTPRQVRQYLESALEAQGFKSGETTPNLVLIYHWGVIRIDHREISCPVPNKEKSRGADCRREHRALGRRGRQPLSGAVPRRAARMTTPPRRPCSSAPLATVVQQARLPRIFIVVSAYDYQSLAQHHEAKLVWTSKAERPGIRRGHDRGDSAPHSQGRGVLWAGLPRCPHHSGPPREPSIRGRAGELQSRSRRRSPTIWTRGSSAASSGRNGSSTRASDERPDSG